MSGEARSGRLPANATLFSWGLAIGRASGSSWAASLFGAAISASFGLVVVGLKALVH